MNEIVNLITEIDEVLKTEDVFELVPDELQIIMRALADRAEAQKAYSDALGVERYQHEISKAKIKNYEKMVAALEALPCRAIINKHIEHIKYIESVQMLAVIKQFTPT